MFSLGWGWCFPIPFSALTLLFGLTCKKNLLQLFQWFSPGTGQEKNQERNWLIKVHLENSHQNGSGRHR